MNVKYYQTIYMYLRFTEFFQIIYENGSGAIFAPQTKRQRFRPFLAYKRRSLMRQAQWLRLVLPVDDVHATKVLGRPDSVIVDKNDCIPVSTARSKQIWPIFLAPSALTAIPDTVTSSGAP